MLICKGNTVSCLVEGRRVRCAGSMLHDPTGRHWPKHSLLIGKFQKGSEEPTEEQYRGAPRDYLGRGYRARVGSVDLPPKRLSEWEEIGPVAEIFYTRPGTSNPGRFRHAFNKPHGVSLVVFPFKGKGKATLRKCGRFHRLDMSRGALIDSRGLVWP
jgi:hypothetical protein